MSNVQFSFSKNVVFKKAHHSTERIVTQSRNSNILECFRKSAHVENLVEIISEQNLKSVAEETRSQKCSLHRLVVESNEIISTEKTHIKICR